MNPVSFARRLYGRLNPVISCQRCGRKLRKWQTGVVPASLHTWRRGLRLCTACFNQHCGPRHTI